MRRMPFNLQVQGGIEAAEEFSVVAKKWKKEGSCFGSEPISVLDTRSPSPPTSSSTLSSSFDSVGVASFQQKWDWPPPPPPPHTQQQQQQQEKTSAQHGHAHGGGGGGGCWGSELQVIPTALQGVNGVEDWVSMLSESGAALGQEQSLLGWIMGEVEDPSSGFKQLLQSGVGLDLQNSSGFGMVDPGFGFGATGGGGSGGSAAATSTTMNLGNFSQSLAVPSCGFPLNNNNGSGRTNSVSNPQSLPNNKTPFFDSPTNLSYQQPQQQFDVKSQAFNFTQNQALFVPSSQTQQNQHLVLQPQQGFSHQLQYNPPHHFQNRPTVAKPKVVGGMHRQQHQQEVFVDQLLKFAELVETGNLVYAQGILARLNQQLSPVGKPLQRAAFLFKEALQLLLLTNNNKGISPKRSSSSLDVVHRINAYKAFSEVSPLLHFTNFTCNQALLEALESYDQIHVVDFDIGFGGQWASFMQEIRMRTGGILLLKITALVSISSHDQPELNLARENLSNFAKELGIPFELNFVRLNLLNPDSLSLAINVSLGEAVAVNLPIGVPTSQLSSLPVLVPLVKQLSPKIVVSVDRGCHRGDQPLSHYVLHSLQSHSNLLESLDVLNVNPEIVHKIEKFYLLPTIERTLIECQYVPTKMPPWRALFASAGFSPIMFSNFTETQAECVLKRPRMMGFHIEKQNGSLMLCWQRQELASVTAWSC